MPSISLLDGITSITNFLIGGTTSSADAANNFADAQNVTKSTIDRTISFTALSADLAGLGASSLQMFKQLASDSSEAGALLGDAAKNFAWLGVFANISMDLPPHDWTCGHA